MVIFYVYSGMIGSRYLEWIQGAVNALIGIFGRVVLMNNVAKSKTMTCQPGYIYAGMSEEDFSRRSKGEWGTYRERLRWFIPCPYYGLELTASSMMNNSRRLHGMGPSVD